MHPFHHQLSFQRKRPPSAWALLREYRLEIAAGYGGGLAIGAAAKYLAAVVLILWIAAGGR